MKTVEQPISKENIESMPNVGENVKEHIREWLDKGKIEYRGGADEGKEEAVRELAGAVRELAGEIRDIGVRKAEEAVEKEEIAGMEEMKEGRDEVQRSKTEE